MCFDFDLRLVRGTEGVVNSSSRSSSNNNRSIGGQGQIQKRPRASPTGPRPRRGLARAEEVAEEMDRGEAAEKTFGEPLALQRECSQQSRKGWFKIVATGRCFKCGYSIYSINTG